MIDLHDLGDGGDFPVLRESREVSKPLGSEKAPTHGDEELVKRGELVNVGLLELEVKDSRVVGDTRLLRRLGDDDKALQERATSALASLPTPVEKRTRSRP